MIECPRHPGVMGGKVTYIRVYRLSEIRLIFLIFRTDRIRMVLIVPGYFNQLIVDTQQQERRRP